MLYKVVYDVLKRFRLWRIMLSSKFMDRPPKLKIGD
jgi:hypothetical protein